MSLVPPWIVLVPGVTAIGVTAVHVFAGRIRGLDAIPRSAALSIAGGASVAYVFVHALPELAHAGRVTGRRFPAIAIVGEHIYLVALLGFVTYYGIEGYARGAARDQPAGDPSRGAFWFHVGSFGAYNGLIGYLLFHPEVPGIQSQLAFGVAMALHALVNDYGLRYHHADGYHEYGRWMLAGAILVGSVIGALTALDRFVLEILFAFLSGGIVLNVIKEELPPERQSRFSAFALGAVGYAAILLAA